MNLTVGELRKLIEGQPDDATVLLQMAEGCCGDTRDLEFSDGRTSLDPQSYKPEPGYIVLEVHPVPGYRSCIQVGGTIKSDEAYWKKEPVTLTPETQDAQWHERKRNMFVHRVRSTLIHHGSPLRISNDTDAILDELKRVLEKRVLSAPPINTLKLEYLRKQHKLYKGIAESQAKEAGKEMDHEKWNMSQVALGQSWAYSEMIGYTRGLNSTQMGLAARKGKL